MVSPQTCLNHQNQVPSHAFTILNFDESDIFNGLYMVIQVSIKACTSSYCRFASCSLVKLLHKGMGFYLFIVPEIIKF